MTTETAIPETTELTITRDIAAPPERVFALWIDPQAMMRWFGIDGMTNLEMAFDARPGGAWFSKARNPSGETFRMVGLIKAIEPNRRIVQSWAHEDAAGILGNETEVEVLFAASAKGCLVTVHHRRIRYTPEAFQEGWTQTLTRIERELAT
ncbi:MAG: SRPBCC domain-containing protein [Pseudomonadota bacterium]